VRVRVVVYNVHGLRAGAGVVARVVDRFRPDLVLLNESGARWRLRRFARALGMQAAADPWSPLRRRVKDAVLVRPPWRIRRHRLVRFEGSERWLPRGAIVAELENEGRPLIAIATHLGLRPAERIRHAGALADLVEDATAPVVLGGDLNERPDGRAVAILARSLRDAWLVGGDVDGDTFPAARPEARIDYLFVGGRIAVDRVLVPAVMPEARAASDHLPVVAELTLPGPG
jgi:endonuclease/exonuclease/phosphatase family metal-dependent hydrolase